MRFAARVSIDGLEKSLQEQLDNCLDVVDGKLNKTATFVRDEAKRSSAFVDKTGNLRKSIRKRKSKYVDGGYIVVATGRNRTKHKGYHAWLIEYGHVKVVWGKRTGERVEPKPFMRPAAEKGREFLLSQLGGAK